MIQLSEYQALALRTEKPLPTPHARMVHALLGLITETGEICTEVKRMAIYEKPLDDARRNHIAEEIGDVMWYLAIAGDAIGSSVFSFPVNLEVPEDLCFSHISLAMSSDIGGLVDAVMFAEDGCDSDSVSNPAEVRERLTMVYANLGTLAAMIGVSIEQIAGENIAKLQERFPDAYSNDAAEARADKGGLDARNS